jgi:circadian clock protein KaiC
LTQHGASPPLARIPTGIPGLDEVTGGGFLQAGVYILQGSPGAGKTIMANHVVHAHAAGGGKVVYVTLLAESHARLLQHMGSFSFFQEGAVPDRIYYVSAFNALRSEGLPGVVNLLRSEMRSRPAGIVVLDGLVMAASAAASEEELKLFVADIQAHSALTGCTTLLLTSEAADRPVSAEQTMVDGILLLREHPFGPRRERNVEVVKFRGSSTLRGNHCFRITPQGIVVHPRLEAARREGPRDAVQPVGVATGVAGLDAMFDIGGYARGSVTALSGRSGAGKTTLALHYLSQATAEEKGLLFGFYESPELLHRTARMQGLAFAPGAVDFMWHTFGENVLDELAASLLDRVARTRPARLVIDGIGGFMAAAAFPERGGSFLATLTNELRRLGTTTVVTVEQQDASRALVLDSASMSALADTVVDLELREGESIRRFATIRKSRISRCDLRRRELRLTDAGLLVRGEEPPGAP